MHHIHVSALDFTVFLAELLIALFLIRMVEARWPDSTVGRALAFVH